MRCEVCGQEIREQPFYRIIEGGRMTVCGQCSKFGSGDWDPRQVNVSQNQRRPAQPRRLRNDLEAAEELELIDNYGELIRKSRQKKKLSVEDFAKKINEKESVVKKMEKEEMNPPAKLIKKIENSVVKKMEKEEMNPPAKLIKKIENALNIMILERGEAPSRVQISTKATAGRTLGDIMKLTQKDEDKE